MQVYYVFNYLVLRSQCSHLTPLKPWKWIHADFAGLFKGKMFFLVMDTHSKWPEIVEMSSTTATKTVKELRRMFAA